MGAWSGGRVVGLAIMGAVLLAPSARGQSPETVRLLPDGRVLLTLQGVSEFATGPFAPFPRARPFENSIEGYFDALAFLLVNQPGVRGQFDAFSRAAASAVDRVPVPSGATSFAYQYDADLGAFVRTDLPMSPSISQNARTNGERIFTFGYAYTYLDYDELDGAERRRVRFSALGGPVENPFSSVPDPGVDFVGRFDYRLTQQIFAFSAQYGVTENFDVGVLVPLVDVEFRGRTNGRFFGVTDDGRYRPLMFDEDFNLVPDDRLRALFPGIGGIDDVAFAGAAVAEPDEDPVLEGFRRVPLGATHEESEFGIGDVVFRSRYHAATIRTVDVGAALNVSTPTGNGDNLLGLDTWRFDPRLLVSKATSRGAAHVNLGYHADVDDSDRDRFDYSVGGELRAYDWLTILVDHIGRYELRGSQPIRSFEVAPGVKVNPWRDVIVAFTAILPLNEEGLTARFAPNVAAEASIVF